jgi:hypothetical protein
VSTRASSAQSLKLSLADRLIAVRLTVHALAFFNALTVKLLID